MVIETLPHPTAGSCDRLRRAAPQSSRHFAERLQELVIPAAAFTGGLLLQIALVLVIGSVIE